MQTTQQQRKSRPTAIHRSALGGYTLDGPYYRHRTFRRWLDRFFHWLGA